MTDAIYALAAGAGDVWSARAWCEIHLDALRHNATRLRERAGVPLLAMVKSDAYGLGALPVARALGAPFANTRKHAAPSPSHVPWGLGVATIAEAEALRTAGCAARILCCAPVLAEELPLMAALQVTPSLHRADDIVAWHGLRRAPWHLAIDTGMNRAGVPWHQVAALREVVAAHPPEGVFTHFHSAELPDGSRETQEQRFRVALDMLALPAGTLRHIDNSPALAASQADPALAASQADPALTASQADPAPTASQAQPAPRDLARPGIALYGSPANTSLDLRPVLHVYARVLDVRDIAAGDTVSYGATWTAPRASRIATVGIGYGDGYRRALSNTGVMLLHGRRVPVAGLVTMDMTMLDVTDVPCAVGDTVTALGAHPELPGALLTIDDLAALSDSSPYELLVGWRLRLPRVYRGAA